MAARAGPGIRLKQAKQHAGNDHDIQRRQPPYRPGFRHVRRGRGRNDFAPRRPLRWGRPYAAGSPSPLSTPLAWLLAQLPLLVRAEFAGCVAAVFAMQQPGKHARILEPGATPKRGYSSLRKGIKGSFRSRRCEQAKAWQLHACLQFFLSRGNSIDGAGIEAIYDLDTG